MKGLRTAAFLAIQALGSLNASSDEDGLLATSYFMLAYNGGYINCKLIVDAPRLQQRVMDDGMSPSLLREIASGEIASARVLKSEKYKLQRKTFSQTLAFIADSVQANRPTFCQSVWNLFGDRGTVYRGILSKPSAPYDPYQLR